MNKPRLIKYQSERIAKTAGAVGLYETRVVLDNAFAKCTGYAVHVVERTAGTDNYSLGLKDDNQQYQDITFATDHEISANVGFEQGRYKKIDIRANGNAVKIQTQIDTALGANLTFDVVFRLENPPA